METLIVRRITLADYIDFAPWRFNRAQLSYRSPRLCSAGHKNFKSSRVVELLFRSEEHTSELQSLMRISYAVFCLKKKKKKINYTNTSSSNENKKTNI